MKRWMILVAVAALGLALLACEGSGTGARPISPLRTPGPSTLRGQAATLEARADAMDATATAWRLVTRQAQDDAYQATAGALALEGTAQAQRVTATAQAVRATREAEAYEATRTAVARDATATARIQEVTATARAAEAEERIAMAQSVKTQVAATAQSVELAGVRERAVNGVRAAVPWILLGLGLVGIGLVGWYLLPTVRVKLGQIQRDLRGDLPMVAVNQNGAVVLYDPARGWGPATRVVNGEVYQPLLTPGPEYQDGMAERSQYVDAAKGGRPRPQVFLPGHSVPALPAGEWQVQEGADEASPPPLQWPSRVKLEELLVGPPTARHLMLGVTMQGGQREVVAADMAQLVHVAVGGTSGWGKSVFLQALAYQLALSAAPVELAMVDLEGCTFSPFARCERLRWPIADTEEGALGIFQGLMEEMDRRKELYAQFPGVAHLMQYNQRAGEPLLPIICLVDEATALLDDKSVEGAVRQVVLRARKYGLWCILGGQDWKASSLDTAIRNQLGSRFQFRAMSASQSRVLLQRSGAETLPVPGRALAVLPGRDLIELQAPLVDGQAIAGRLQGGGPQGELPRVAPGTSGEDAEVVEQILALKGEGASDTRIAREVFRHGTTYYIEKVREILRQQQQKGHNNTGEMGVS